MFLVKHHLCPENLNDVDLLPKRTRLHFWPTWLQNSLLGTFNLCCGDRWNCKCFSVKEDVTRKRLCSQDSSPRSLLWNSKEVCNASCTILTASGGETAGSVHDGWLSSLTHSYERVHTHRQGKQQETRPKIIQQNHSCENRCVIISLCNSADIKLWCGIIKVPTASVMLIKMTFRICFCTVCLDFLYLSSETWLMHP